jgi:hypothetical protein
VKNRQGQRLLPRHHKYADYYAVFAFFTAAHRSSERRRSSSGRLDSSCDDRALASSWVLLLPYALLPTEPSSSPTIFSGQQGLRRMAVT